MDKDSILEICDVVCDRVMENVDQRINISLHQIDTYIQHLQNDVQTLKKENQQLHSKISELEEKINNIQPSCNNITASQKTEYNGNLKPQRITARAIDGISTLLAKQMDDILSFPGRYLEGNGWIYYIKNEQIFKVRPDGTENQKIFGGKVNKYLPELYLKEDTLWFKDSEFNTRCIKV